jgi:hypothetical protein
MKTSPKIGRLSKSINNHIHLHHNKVNNPDINAKVNVMICGALELSKYHSNYPPHGIYGYQNMTHS